MAENSTPSEEIISTTQPAQTEVESVDPQVLPPQDAEPPAVDEV